MGKQEALRERPPHTHIEGDGELPAGRRRRRRTEPASAKEPWQEEEEASPNTGREEEARAASQGPFLRRGDGKGERGLLIGMWGFIYLGRGDRERGGGERDKYREGHPVGLGWAFHRGFVRFSLL